MRYSVRTEQSGGGSSSPWDAHNIATEMIAQGNDAILLTVGDTDFASPSVAADEVGRSIVNGNTKYAPSAGNASLRKAIAERFSLQSGVSVNAEQVVVTAGAQNALFITALCVIDAGDEVLVPEPMYVTYPGVIKAAGGVIVPIRSPAELNFHPRLDELEAAVTSNTRAIFLATPNNPTGAVYTGQELEKIAEICCKHDLWLISDEVYCDMIYQGEHVSPATLPDVADRTITIGSLSKSHAMPGWRVGWMIAPVELAKRATALMTSSTYGIPTFIQDAATATLSALPHGLPDMKLIYSARRSRVCERLNSIEGLSCLPPAGGMFVMLDVSATGMAPYDYAMGLVRSFGVAVLPAEEFGESASRHVRVNLGVADHLLDEAIERIERYTSALHRGAT